MMISCASSLSSPGVGRKEKGLHVALICVILLASPWGHSRCEQFLLSPATAMKCGCLFAGPCE